MDNQLPNFPVQSQNYIAPNSLPMQMPTNVKPPSSHRFNINKKWLLTILIIFLLVTLPTITYFLGKQAGTAKTANLAQDMNSVNITPSVPTSTPIPTPTPKSTGEVVWNVQKQNLTPTEIEIKNAFAAYIATPSADFNYNRRLAVISLEVSTVSASFAITNMEFVDATNQVIATGGFSYYLYKTSSVWNIMSGNESNFCTTIKTFPSDLLTDNLKLYLAGCFPQ